MGTDRYILNDKGEPELCPDLNKWGRWMQEKKRQVARTQVNDKVHVSTVFLGLDHNFGFAGPPTLWETMIFGGPHDQYQRRYTSKEDALKGHQEALEGLLDGNLDQ